MSDPLFFAAKALRDTTDGEPSAAARSTRARVLASVRQRQRRRVINVAFGIPLAAILVGSGAWAASGENLPRLVRRVSEVFGLDSSSSETATEKRPRSATKSVRPPAKQTVPAPSSPAATAVEAPPDAGLEAPPDVKSVESAGSPEPPKETSDVKLAWPPKVSSQSRAKSPLRDSKATEHELELYAAAHRAHFADKDPTRALAAWNEYLRQSPQGRFSVEARYNRALCLVRLGRNAEARVALKPFVRGSYADYRKAEATALDEQLAGAAE